MTRTPVYLDYASTTPVDPKVAAQMTATLTMEGNFGNPASRSHRFGWVAEEAVDVARNQIADLVNCDPREIVFTSGATESDNLAIKGVVDASDKQQKHVITVATEHKAVLDTVVSVRKLRKTAACKKVGAPSVEAQGSSPCSRSASVRLEHPLL